MNVYFIRHGETHANENHQFAGFWDVDLTERGRMQAEIVSDKLRDIHFHKIFSSDLIRARRTCEPIARCRAVEPLYTEALREMNFGSWEGLTFGEIKANYPELLDKWFKSYDDFQVPSGESTKQMYRRVIDFYKKNVLEDERDKDINILFVAHGGVIQAILSHLCYGDVSGFWRFQVDNCSINRVEYVMGYPVIKSINK